MHNVVFTVVKMPTLSGKQNNDWLTYFSNEESQVSVSGSVFPSACLLTDGGILFMFII